MANEEGMRLLREQAERYHEMMTQPGGSDKWIGHVVKVGFMTSNPQINREWMYVEVNAVEGDKLVGRLLNQPQFAPNLKHGDRVVFGADDICGVAE